MTHNINTFHLKTKIRFGRGALGALADAARELGASRFLLVADPAMESSGALERALDNLRAGGLSGETFTGIEAEPYLDGADKSAGLGRGAGAQVVIGLGGGSAMDTAKAAAALIANGGKAEDYIGLNLVPGPALKTIMIPTTAGTGSEVTFTAVFTNRTTKAKGGINSDFLFPDLALLDPELTLSLPPQVTAATGMDALTHAIESFTGRAAGVFTEALALTSIRLISENLRRAVFYGDDIEAREKMLLGSSLGGMALADAGVGAAHALAYPLGGFHRVPHGLANAMLLVHVMKFNSPAVPDRFARIAAAMGEDVSGLPERRAAARAVEAVATLCRDIEIPQSLSELDVPRSNIPAMVEAALKVARPVANNPRPLTSEHAARIYAEAFGPA
jgi:alcohol dehydrogenase